MANIKSAKKRIKVIDKKTARNIRVKNHIKEAEKAFLAAIESGNAEEAKKASVFNAETKKSIGNVNMPASVSAMAYDVTSDRYYLANGKEIYICDSNFKVEKTLAKTIKHKSTQDIGAYNSTVMVCSWLGKNKSYIDIYRVSDGAYLGSYDVSIGEIESCVVDDGYLVILMNTIGSADDRIYKTKERIAIP
jgi:hypothetical protein